MKLTIFNYKIKKNGLQHFSDPTLFPYEVCEEEIKKQKKKCKPEDLPEETVKALESINYPKDQEFDERYVHYISILSFLLKISLVAQQPIMAPRLVVPLTTLEIKGSGVKSICLY